MSSACTPDTPRTGTGTWRQTWGVWALVFGSLILYATIRTPIPGTNEPHYLTKARALWDPHWCHRDPFIQSAPVHWVFYALMNRPVIWWGFETAAAVGRLCGWGLLAAGWTALGRALKVSSWGIVLWLWGTLTLASIGNFSGEWVVGGIEGKVFSYGAVWLSLAALLRGHFPSSGIWAGVAVAFHPVVGIWNALALACGPCLLQWKSRSPTFFKQIGAGLIGGGLLSLPGLLPALAILKSNNQGNARAADEIQVFERLAHHLNPQVFPLSAYSCYVVLSLIFVSLIWRSGGTQSEKSFARYVVWTGIFALAGLGIGFALPSPLSAKLLKFYPFRLMDVFLPIAVIFELVRRSESQIPKLAPHSFVKMSGILCGVLAVTATFGIPRDAHPSRLPSEQWQDWIDACAWIKRETPSDALFLTSHRGWGFKWYAERAELFNYKDCPQDAKGIVEWSERQSLLWDLFQEGFSQSGLEKLRRQTRCNYLFVLRGTPCPLKPCYHNQTFVVYPLPP